jgi:hypothetical protein
MIMSATYRSADVARVPEIDKRDEPGAEPTTPGERTHALNPD